MFSAQYPVTESETPLQKYTGRKQISNYNTMSLSDTVENAENVESTGRISPPSKFNFIFSYTFDKLTLVCLLVIYTFLYQVLLTSHVSFTNTWFIIYSLTYVLFIVCIRWSDNSYLLVKLLKINIFFMNKCGRLIHIFVMFNKLDSIDIVVSSSLKFLTWWSWL